MQGRGRLLAHLQSGAGQAAAKLAAPPRPRRARRALGDALAQRIEHKGKPFNVRRGLLATAFGAAAVGELCGAGGEGDMRGGSSCGTRLQKPMQVAANPTLYLSAAQGPSGTSSITA